MSFASIESLVFLSLSLFLFLPSLSLLSYRFWILITKNIKKTFSGIQRSHHTSHILSCLAIGGKEKFSQESSLKASFQNSAKKADG